MEHITCSSQTKGSSGSIQQAKGPGTEGRRCRTTRTTRTTRQGDHGPVNAAEDGPDKARINFILFKLFESAATTSASLTIPGYAEHLHDQDL